MPHRSSDHSHLNPRPAICPDRLTKDESDFRVSATIARTDAEQMVNAAERFGMADDAAQIGIRIFEPPV